MTTETLTGRYCLNIDKEFIVLHIKEGFYGRNIVVVPVHNLDGRCLSALKIGSTLRMIVETYKGRVLMMKAIFSTALVSPYDKETIRDWTQFKHWGNEA